MRLSSHNSDTGSSIGGDGNTPATATPTATPTPGLRLGNVRIVVEGGGKLTVGMGVDVGVDGVCRGGGSAAAGAGISTLTLEGATSQVCLATATYRDLGWLSLCATVVQGTFASSLGTRTFYSNVPNLSLVKGPPTESEKC